MSTMIRRPLTTDTYRTTHEFRSIDSHAAVCLDDDLRGLVAVCGPAGDELSEATARLFAAAPELLEALEALSRASAGDYTISKRFPGLREKVGAALAKAKGETP